jgi:hypothetical protein
MLLLLLLLSLSLLLSLLLLLSPSLSFSLKGACPSTSVSAAAYLSFVSETLLSCLICLGPSDFPLFSRDEPVFLLLLLVTSMVALAPHPVESWHSGMSFFLSSSVEPCCCPHLRCCCRCYLRGPRS